MCAAMSQLPSSVFLSPCVVQWLHVVFPTSRKRHLASLFPGGCWFDADIQRQIFIWGCPVYLSCVVFLPGPVGTNNKFISMLGNEGWTFQ